MKKIKIGLVPKLLIAIVLGILFGQLGSLPTVFLQIPITISSLFSSVLSFIIPLMIIGYVVIGIADLTQGAGKLLGATTLISYGSTLVGGVIAYVVASNIFPIFITPELSASVTEGGEGLAALFTIPLEPMLDVTSAIVFAFLFGISISWLRGQNKGETIYNFFNDFSAIITRILNSFIIPGLPIYIFGNFVNLSYTGSIQSILTVFWRVFLIVLALQLLGVIVLFIIAGIYRKEKPWQFIKNQIPGYITAVGTQSSAATIPVNVEIARKNGVSQQIREFVVPLCATIHLYGSITTVTSCVTAVLIMYGMPFDFPMMMGFILVLGIAMVAAPGAPGGAIMSALPFLPVVGIPAAGPIATLLISLYLTQDSFGTAANVSGDNAIALIIDKIYHTKILKDKSWTPSKNPETEIVKELNT
ncbi:dicarboxylate/amino acid:cation symporter [Desemzia sp. RIT804]|uniref:dicarboxylate/amino acid:cation symporter n=1 Tax=Desemzia sp. RIT 804 TaxID=2810209 RepID=UPI00194EC309|nr:dicarboxylate/amino acid:cation symporter [Desemzia sp. RIT 804]MBM6614669.1 dicarboxylate/amino acid:cation symporter [Desemzia sp. RIT 804]